jgi:hypothetical protein
VTFFKCCYRAVVMPIMAGLAPSGLISWTLS